MKLRMVYTAVCALLVAAAMAISTPASAQGLIGVTITSCFDNIFDCPNDQHWDNDTAIVADPGVEFTGIGTPGAGGIPSDPNPGDIWTADFSGATGSRLTITGCCAPFGHGVGQGVYKFRFEDLDFAGGQAITNVIVDPASTLPLLVPISFTSNSITIALNNFNLFSGERSLILDIVTVAPVPPVGTAAISEMNFLGFAAGFSSPVVLGWEFSTNTSVTVTALGIVDVEAPGLLALHEVGIWDSAGSLLASATIPAGTAAPIGPGLITGIVPGSYRYVSIPAVELPSGQIFTVGALYVGDGRFDGVINNAPTLILDPSITFGRTRMRTSTSVLVFPDQSPFPSFGPFGPTFLFTQLAPTVTADLSITKMDDPDPVLAGETLTYTVEVTNNGPDDADNVVVSDALPASVAFVGTTGCDNDANGVPNCQLGTITADAMKSYTITVTADATATGTITNAATVTSDADDTVPGNNDVIEDTGVIQLVDIDIKPGSFPNSVNSCSKGVIPVAILGSASLDVSTIDPDRLTFADAGVKTVGKTGKMLCRIEDVSGDFTFPEGAPDDFLDLVCQFLTVDLGSSPGDTTAAVKGELFDGQLIEGSDSINIVKDDCL